MAHTLRARALSRTPARIRPARSVCARGREVSTLNPVGLAAQYAGAQEVLRVGLGSSTAVPIDGTRQHIDRMINEQVANAKGHDRPHSYPLERQTEERLTPRLSRIARSDQTH
jgi:hypothetical protein